MPSLWKAAISKGQKRIRCGVLFRRFSSNQAGAIAVMVGLAMPIFAGGLGLGAEVSFWYFTQRKLQNAADVAAYAGAAILRTTTDQQDIEDAALAAAQKTGYDETIGTMTVSLPASTGAYAGMANTVEVTLQEDVHRMLSAVFLDGDVPISGRAVAKVHHSRPACILALDPNASGSVTFTGSSDAVLENCNVHSNSIAEDAVSVTGSGQVSTPCVSAVGGISATSGLTMDSCNFALANAEPITDPYAGVPEPSVSGSCAPENEFAGPEGSVYIIDPDRYCGGLIMKRTVTMNPGVYVVDGGTFEIQSGAIVSGEGVMIFLTNDATISISGFASVQMSAPTSGTYKGMLIFVDRDNSYDTQVLNGDSSTEMTGAIYASNSHVLFAGSNTVGGGCTQIVALTVEITGDAGLGSNCTGTGVSDIDTDQLVLLVE